LSLALNLEANVFIRDRAFNASMHTHLEDLMRTRCQEISAASLGPISGLALVRSYLAFHVIRQFPRWARWLPRHAPRLYSAIAGLRATPVAPRKGPT
jgi:cardiolipin synthase